MTEYSCPWDGCERSFDTKTGVSLHHYRAHGERFSLTRQEYECTYCGDTFERQPCQIVSERVFCSKSCNSSYHTEPERHHNRLKKTVPCDWCGNEIERAPWQLERVDRYFCSDECTGRYRKIQYRGENGPTWNGGWDEYYGPTWTRQRRKSLERDGYECVICGDGPDELGKNPDVHHIVPHRCFSQTKAANQLGNLVTLCPKHHSAAEHGRIDTPIPASPMTPQLAED